MGGAREMAGLLTYDLLVPALLGISFMHRKNVEVERQPVPPKLAKAYTKRHGRPMVRFHILRIEPMRKVLRDAGAEGTTGIQMAGSRDSDEKPAGGARC